MTPRPLYTFRHTFITQRDRKNVPSNVIFFPFAFKEAPANVLTNPKLDPIGKIPEFKYCAAKMEKIEKSSSFTYK